MLKKKSVKSWDSKGQKKKMERNGKVGPRFMSSSLPVASSTMCDSLNIPSKYFLRYKKNSTFIHQY